jgi:predicted nucleic acid-binding protein
MPDEDFARDVEAGIEAHREAPREMAKLAAKIDAEAQKQGNRIPFGDLQIGVTALHIGFAVGTSNVRWFRG